MSPGNRCMRVTEFLASKATDWMSDRHQWRQREWIIGIKVLIVTNHIEESVAIISHIYDSEASVSSLWMIHRHQSHHSEWILSNKYIVFMNQRIHRHHNEWFMGNRCIRVKEFLASKATDWRSDRHQWRKIEWFRGINVLIVRNPIEESDAIISNSYDSEASVASLIMIHRHQRHQCEWILSNKYILFMNQRIQRHHNEWFLSIHCISGKELQTANSTYWRSDMHKWH